MAKRITDTATGTINVEGVDGGGGGGGGEPDVAPFRIRSVDIPEAMEPGDKEQVVIEWRTDDPGRSHFIDATIADEQIVDQEYSSMNREESLSSFVFEMPVVDEPEVEWTVEIGVDE